MMKRQMEIR